MIRDLKNYFPNNSIPIWLMRQAGRYLPEYRKVRSQKESFLELCYSPKLITEITLQPITRFDFDAAIIFSDILVIPDALGIRVTFKESIGPIVEKITRADEIPPLNKKKFLEHMAPIYEAISATKEKLINGSFLLDIYNYYFLRIYELIIF